MADSFLEQLQHTNYNSKRKMENKDDLSRPHLRQEDMAESFLEQLELQNTNKRKLEDEDDEEEEYPRNKKKTCMTLQDTNNTQPQQTFDENFFIADQ